MSAPLAKDTVLFWQRLYACAGFYKAKLDGVHGTGTAAAEVRWNESYRLIRDESGKLHSRTEACLATVLPAMQRRARALLRLLLAELPIGMTAQVLSGTRTYPEQDALYRQGRWGDKRPRVTNAKAGQSWHNFGLAVDIGLFQRGKYLTASAPYEAAGKIGRGVPGLSWGGDWKSFRDLPHYQADVPLTLAQARERFEAGKLTV